MWVWVGGGEGKYIPTALSMCTTVEGQKQKLCLLIHKNKKYNCNQIRTGFFFSGKNFHMNSTGRPENVDQYFWTSVHIY